jgi:anion-transporting  ArsA/GET3 family ATPase
MLPGPVSLLDRQLLYITGKGGVGKTTVAAAAGLAAAEQGRRVVVCEVSGQARIPAMLGVEAGRPGDEVRVRDGLWATTIDPRRALEEWLARVLGSKQLTQLLARSNFFSAFVAAAPGAAELVTITKAWDLAQDERWDRRARGYDLVVVDGPASGHGLGMLRTPGTFRDIARVGPIASQAERVREWLGDSRQTAYLAVALAAELPVTETIELGQKLRRTLGRRLEAIVANAILPDRFGDGELAELPADGLVANMVRGAAARADAQGEQLDRLRGQCEARVTGLPFVFAPALDEAALAAFAGVLGDAL